VVANETGRLRWWPGKRLPANNSLDLLRVSCTEWGCYNPKWGWVKYGFHMLLLFCNKRFNIKFIN